MCAVAAAVAAVAAAASAVAILAAAVATGVASALWEAHTCCSCAGVFQLCYVGRFDFLCEPGIVFTGLMLMFVKHSDGGFHLRTKKGGGGIGGA